MLPHYLLIRNTGQELPLVSPGVFRDIHHLPAKVAEVSIAFFSATLRFRPTSFIGAGRVLRLAVGSFRLNPLLLQSSWIRSYDRRSFFPRVAGGAREGMQFPSTKEVTGGS